MPDWGSTPQRSTTTTRGRRRDDWTFPELMARWGRIAGCHNDRGRHIAPCVTLWLPWPDNKAECVRSHLRRLGVAFTERAYPGWTESRGRRYARPQAVFIVTGIRGCATVFDSIGWRCGHPRKDATMAAWRRDRDDATTRKRLAMFFGGGH